MQLSRCEYPVAPAISMKFLKGAASLYYLVPRFNHSRWNEINQIECPSLYLFESCCSFDETIAFLSHKIETDIEKNLSPSLESCLRRIGIGETGDSEDHPDEAAHQVPAGKSSFLFRRVTYPTLSNTCDSQLREEDLVGKHGETSARETSLGGSMSEKDGHGIQSKKGAKS